MLVIALTGRNDDALPCFHENDDAHGAELNLDKETLAKPVKAATTRRFPHILEMSSASAQHLTTQASMQAPLRSQKYPWRQQNRQGCLSRQLARGLHTENRRVEQPSIAPMRPAEEALSFELASASNVRTLEAQGHSGKFPILLSKQLQTWILSPVYAPSRPVLSRWQRKRPLIHPETQPVIVPAGSESLLKSVGRQNRPFHQVLHMPSNATNNTKTSVSSAAANDRLTRQADHTSLHNGGIP